MLPWEKRSTEIANLLNPAFGAVLIRQFIDGYFDRSGGHTPYLLAYTVLPFVLHAQSRTKLPKRFDRRTKLLAFLHEYPEIRADLPSRIISIKPVSRESIIFGIQNQLFIIGEAGMLESNGKRIAGRGLWENESEPLDCFKKAELLGKIFANTGDVSSVCIMLGIMP